MKSFTYGSQDLKEWKYYVQLRNKGNFHLAVKYSIGMTVKGSRKSGTLYLKPGVTPTDDQNYGANSTGLVLLASSDQSDVVIGPIHRDFDDAGNIIYTLVGCGSNNESSNNN